MDKTAVQQKIDSGDIKPSVKYRGEDDGIFTSGVGVRGAESDILVYENVHDPDDDTKTIPAIAFSITDAREYVRNVIAQILMQYPSLHEWIGAAAGEAGLNVYVVADDPALETMATDHRNIYINPLFLWKLAHKNTPEWTWWNDEDYELTPEERYFKWPNVDIGSVAVIIHECYHCFRLHRVREERFQKKHPEITDFSHHKANIVMDQEINSTLEAMLSFDIYPDMGGTQTGVFQLLGGVLFDEPGKSFNKALLTDKDRGGYNIISPELYKKIYTGPYEWAEAPDTLGGGDVREIYGWKAKKKIPTAFGSCWEDLYLYFQEHGWPSWIEGPRPPKMPPLPPFPPKGPGPGEGPNQPPKLPKNQARYEDGYYSGYYAPEGKDITPELRWRDDDYDMGYMDGMNGRHMDDVHGTHANSPEYIAGVEAARNGNAGISESGVLTFAAHNLVETGTFTKKKLGISLNEAAKLLSDCGYLCEWTSIDTQHPYYREGVQSVLDPSSVRQGSKGGQNGQGGKGGEQNRRYQPNDGGQGSQQGGQQDGQKGQDGQNGQSDQSGQQGGNGKRYGQNNIGGPGDNKSDNEDGGQSRGEGSPSDKNGHNKSNKGQGGGNGEGQPKPNGQGGGGFSGNNTPRRFGQQQPSNDDFDKSVWEKLPESCRKGIEERVKDGSVKTKDGSNDPSKAELNNQGEDSGSMSLDGDQIDVVRGNELLSKVPGAGVDEVMNDPDKRWKEKNLNHEQELPTDQGAGPLPKEVQQELQKSSHSGTGWNNGCLATKQKIMDAMKSDINWQDKLCDYIRGAFKAMREKINKKDISMDREFIRKVETEGGDSIGNIAFALDQSGSMWGQVGKKDYGMYAANRVPSAMRKFFKEIAAIRERIGKPIKGIATFSFASDESRFMADYFKEGVVAKSWNPIDKSGGTDFSNVLRNMKLGRVYEKKNGHRLWTSFDDNEFPVVTVICTDGEDDVPPRKVAWDTDSKLIIWFVINSDQKYVESFKERLKKAGYPTRYYIGITTDQI